MELVVDILLAVFWVLVAIMILVFVHEMGHFLFAKLFGMRVDRFSIGFPPKIVGKQIGETEYMIGATPLGGYVKIAGMVDESMDTDELESEPQPWEYRAKPVWQRIVVITAGVIFNMILAYFIFAGLKWAYGETFIPAENIEEVYVGEETLAYDMGLRTGDRIVAVSGHRLERYEDLLDFELLLADPFTITVVRGGEERTFEGPEDIMTQLGRRGWLGIDPVPSLIGGVGEGSGAQQAGLQEGDRITAIGGAPVRFWQEMTEKVQMSEGDPLVVRWERPDSLLEAGRGALEPVLRRGDVAIFEEPVTPQFDDDLDRYLLGVARPAPNSALLRKEFGERTRTYSLGGALVAGAGETVSKTRAIGTSLQRVFTGKENFRENVGGPVAIARVTKQAAEAGAETFWNIVAFLSITLAIMNILPIPALDGGHLVFLIYEAITRREPSLRVRMALQQVGMILLLVFMTFLIFNDVLRLWQ